jgi:hypothetical protein
MSNHTIGIEAAPRQIECLCCGAERIMIGRDAGDCPRCHYLGWTYSDELDGWTRRMIVNRELGVRPGIDQVRAGLTAPGFATGT